MATTPTEPTISGFLNELAFNADLADRFRSSADEAESVMRGYGLNDEQRDLIRNGNLVALRDAVEREDGRLAVIMIKMGTPPS